MIPFLNEGLDLYRLRKLKDLEIVEYVVRHVAMSGEMSGLESYLMRWNGK